MFKIFLNEKRKEIVHIEKLLKYIINYKKLNEF